MACIAKQQSNIPLMHQFFVVNKNGFPPSTILPLNKTPQNVALTLADGIGKFIFLKVMSEDQPLRAVVNRAKHIAPGARVLGKFGDFISSTNGKRWKQARIYGHVLEAAAANKYWVIFNNNTTLECFSNSLHLKCLFFHASRCPPTSFTGSQG